MPRRELRPCLILARSAAYRLVSDLDAMGIDDVTTVEDPNAGVVKVYGDGKLQGWTFSVRDEED